MTVTFQLLDPVETITAVEAHHLRRFPRREELAAPTISKREEERFAKVSSWLTSRALRALNDDKRQPFLEALVESAVEEVELSYLDIVSWDFRTPDHADPRFDGLVDYLADLATDVLPTEYLNIHNLEQQVASCASFALETWDPAFNYRLSEAGRKGGKASTRGKKITIELLQLVEGMSKSMQAEALGCSTATIARRRRELGMSTKPLEVSA